MKTDFSNVDYRAISTNIRVKILRMIHKAKASHVGSALSIVDLLAVLYHSGRFDFVANKPISERDSFILSKGHACTALYATLNEIEVLSDELMITYGEDGSPLMHHVSHKVPGIDLSTGSLGHGLPVSVGLAYTDKIDKKNNRRVCIIGDGELAEGSNWEALLFAAHHKLSNLTIIVDNNNLQSLDTVEKTLNLYPLEEKFAAFGCNVVTIDGHDHAAITLALDNEQIEKPKIIIAKTTKGKGVSFMENSVMWHYKNPSDADLISALSELTQVDNVNA